VKWASREGEAAACSVDVAFTSIMSKAPAGNGEKQNARQDGGRSVDPVR
jgi:hypothetical protein